MGKNDDLQTISIIYKLFSYQQTSELIYGFGESENARGKDLTNNKTEKKNIFLTRKLRDLFVFADQENVTFGLIYSHLKT